MTEQKFPIDTVFEQHPIGKLIPKPSKDEFDAIVDSMVRQGFLVNFPIVIYQDQILDGFTRYQAAREAQKTLEKASGKAFVQGGNGNNKPSLMLELNTVDLGFKDDGEATEYVYTSNGMRRHIHTGGRAMLATGIVNMTKDPQHRVTIKTAAKRLAVSSRTLNDAISLKKSGAQDLIDAVISGDMPVSVAIATLAKRESKEFDKENGGGENASTGGKTKAPQSPSKRLEKLVIALGKSQAEFIDIFSNDLTEPQQEVSDGFRELSDAIERVRSLIIDEEGENSSIDDEEGEGFVPPGEKTLEPPLTDEDD